MGIGSETVSIIRKGNMKLKKMKFIENYSPYKAGDIAGFSEEFARFYLNKKVAVEVENEVKVKAIESPPVDKMVKSPKVKK